MTQTEQNVCDTAVERLQKEMETAEKAYAKASTAEMMIRKVLTPAVGGMLIKFCYQDERFARAVLDSKKDFMECLKEIALLSSRDKPAISDVEAYATAVKFYFPDAQVSVSFRILLPCEVDDDLLFLDVPALSAETNENGQAMILDLFGTGEV